MKYEYSNLEIGGYKVCDLCGKRCRTNYGIEFRCTIPNNIFSVKRGLCRKCANKLTPEIMHFYDSLGGYDCDWGDYE